MASADEYAAWIVANQARKGTPEFETVARAYQEAKTESAPKADSGVTETGLPFKPFGVDTGLTMPQGVSRFMAGTGMGMTNVARGVRQLFDKPGASGKSPLQSEIDDAAKRDAPLMNTGAGFAGNITGNIAATAPAMFIPGANTVAGGALIGGGLGAIQPVATGDSRAVNVGAGMVGGAAIPGAAALLRTGKSLVEPLYEGGRNTVSGRLLNRVAGENAPEVEKRLALARELVPGSRPTAAEVAESGGVSAVQRMAAQADPESYAQRGMEQASARMSAVRGIAGTPDDLAQMKAVRDLMSGPLYDQAKQAKVPLSISDRKVSELMQRPSLQEAWADAEKMAREAGITSVTSKGEMTGETLHYLKMALDQKIADAKPGSPAQRLLMGTRDELRVWMEKAIPEYGKARQAFAAYSPGVDQAKVGAYLSDALQPALSDYGALGKETAARYAQALRNAPSTLNSATGFGGATRELADVMAPNQMNILENVGRDLGRKANAQDLGRGVGSNTFQNLAMENIAQQSGMPAATSFLLNLPGVSRATNWIYRETDAKTRAQLAQALLNPQSSAMLMRQAQGNPKLIEALREIQRTTIPAGAALSLPNAQQQ